MKTYPSSVLCVRISDAASRLKVCSSLVYRRIEQARVPHIRLPTGTLALLVPDLNALLRGHRPCPVRARRWLDKQVGEWPAFSFQQVASLLAVSRRTIANLSLYDDDTHSGRGHTTTFTLHICGRDVRGADLAGFVLACYRPATARPWRPIRPGR